MDKEKYVIDNYKEKSINEISKKIGESKIWVKRTAYLNGLVELPDSSWSIEEDKYIIENMNDYTYKEIAKKIGRPKGSVGVRVYYLRYYDILEETNSGSWKHYEDDFLKDNRHTMMYKEIADHLGRTESAVQMRVYKLKQNGEIDKTHSRNTLDEEDLSYLKNSYGIVPDEEIIKNIKKDIEVHTLHNICQEYGVQKTKNREKWLIENVEGKTIKELQMGLNMSRTGVHSMLTRLGLRDKYKNPTRIEKERKRILKAYIKGSLKKKTIGEMANEMDCDYSTIFYLVKQFGFYEDMKKHGTIKDESFTDEEEEVIKENYGKLSHRRIAEEIGRPRTSVSRKIRYMKKKGKIK